MPANNIPQMKPYVASIHAYVPGRSKAKDGRALKKLSANENPLGTSPAALAALDAGSEPRLYPDPDSMALREAIGALHGIDPARIVCGTGSGELLNCAAQAYAGLGDEIIFSKYSFSLYPLLAAKVGASAIIADDGGYKASADALLSRVSERTRIIFLDNPNNPLGSWLTREEVSRLHSGLPSNVLLVLDQAYAEYLPQELDDGGLELSARADNVIVTRTFSKIYGLAGERIGWATGAAHLVDALNRIRGPFNVTLSGQRAALAALEDQDFVAASREHNASERARFVAAIEALGNHGLRAVPSEANFVLVLFEGALRAEDALDGLAEAGYAVRHLPGQGLPDALRITIGSVEDMTVITETLRQLAERAK